MAEEATLKFRFTAGMAIRKSVVGHIKDAAFDRGIKCEIDEDKGFLESSFRVRMTGEKDVILKFKLTLERYLDNLSKD